MKYFKEDKSGNHMNIEKRVEIFTLRENELIAQGFLPKEKTISVLKANIYALFTAGPIAFLCFVLFYLRFPEHYYVISQESSHIFFIALIVCIFVHEILHGIGWGIFCKDKKSISFGMMWKQLTPYCSCAEPLTYTKYLIGSLLPFFILGIVMFMIALFTENTGCLYLSILNILSAGGDTTISLLLWNHRKDIIVDHPTKVGFIAYHK